MIIPAAKSPLPFLKTIVLGVLTAVAVVALLETLPTVVIVASFVSTIAAVADTLLSSIAPALIIGAAEDVPTPPKSPANCTLPFISVVASGVAAVTIDAST